MSNLNLSHCNFQKCSNSDNNNNNSSSTNCRQLISLKQW